MASEGIANDSAKKHEFIPEEVLFLVCYFFWGGGKGEISLFFLPKIDLVLIIWKGEWSWLKCLKLKLMFFCCYGKFLHNVHTKVELDEVVVFFCLM